MPNMSLKKVDMPIQDPQIRRSNFDEVALGYTAEQAMEEAQRCLHCPTRPCVSGCPVSVNIPDFIEAVKDGEFEKAYHIIRETSSLPAVCGRVCPQETQCERECVRGKKVKAWRSDALNVSLRTGIGKMSMKFLKKSYRTDIKWLWSVQVLPD